ncbi:MAG: hypothetical protein PVH24_05255 [Candidatus Zixiibacteriota bacterium]|jgi:hypothetical protein
MVSYQPLLYSFLVSGVYLLIISAIAAVIERRANLLRPLPEEQVEPIGVGWFVVNFIMELLFYVVIPAFAYSFFYLVLPISGVRAGMAVALVAFTLGAVPLVMSLSVRVRLPMPYLLFLLLAYIIKIGGSLVLIGLLYSL